MHNIIEEIVPEVGAQIEGCESCDSSNPEGIFICSQMMEELSTYINLANFPIKSCKSEYFEHVIQPSFQSGFRKKPLSLLIKRAMIAAYKRDKKSLKEYFLNFGGSVAVTADLWSSEWSERFVCVTCRWIDDDDGCWSVENRVIGFRVIKDDATCNEICWEICNVLDVFKLWTKVFCISLGTGLNGDEYVESLTNRINPIERGIISNVRSCAYAANLCAQRGGWVKTEIFPFGLAKEMEFDV
uniref:Uncharacterized protein n=1 Tax=Chenopodium quinoa TaxID=63459 RepID=A0A803LE61_CHEQI